LNGRATGLTLALTVALALGLSFAPVPHAWRPLPSLAGDDVPGALAQLLIPQRTTGFGQKDAITGAPLLALEEPEPDEAPGESEEWEGLDLRDSEPPPEHAPLELSPSATLGAAEAREVRILDRLVKRVGGQHVDLEYPEALEPFFSRIEALQRGELQDKVRVVHLGDSQIASDHITDVVRRRLELRYGSGGPGFLFVDRPTRNAGRKVRTGEATDGWEVTKLTDKQRPGVFGFSGVRFTAPRTQQAAQFELRNARTAELFFVGGPQGGTVDLSADGTLVQQIRTRLGQEDLGFQRIALPDQARMLTLSATQGEVSLLGVSLESDSPGIVYDTVGLPGALFDVYLRSPEATFVSQLGRRSPALVVVMLGGNEAYEIGRKWITLETARKNAEALVDRVRAAAPDASCLLVAPMDAAVRTVSGELEPRPNTAEVGAMIREVAQAKGCAFWDLYRAMGGDRSVARWLGAGLFNQDLVHPRARGADVLGHLFDFALERARAQRPGARAPRFSEPPGLVAPGGTALARVARRLGQRPVLLQLGASHTASHQFTDAVRAELQKAHGDGGRGFVAAGRPSDRLLPARVKRTLEGPWEVPDAREGQPGEPWGLTGVRAVGQKGARLSIAFGVGEKPSADAAQLSLFYLESSGMGRMRVRVDGVAVAELGPGPAPGEAPPSMPRARVHPIEVKGSSHVIEVENLGEGPITVFGASLEKSASGLVYDALGLPGATVMLADGFHKPTFVEQLRARRPDAYVVFYGTNESALEGLSADTLRTHYVSLLRTLRQASPEADCLLIGPTDRIRVLPGGEVAEAVAQERVNRTVREVAEAEGCAYWSARAAMGGPLSMRRWQSVHPPLGHPDGVHLTPEGYEALGRAFADDLNAALRAAARGGT
jgi:lysophospholipase L1-like esterase